MDNRENKNKTLFGSLTQHRAHGAKQRKIGCKEFHEKSFAAYGKGTPSRARTVK